MERKVLLKAYILIFLFLQFYVQCFGLEKDTHMKLNEYVAKNSINGFSLNSYLLSQLGYQNGVDEIFSNGKMEKEAWKWVQDGGQYEDEPYYTRSFNHFHDPLQPWYIAGFDKTFKSSLIWAQDQGSVSSLFGGDWDWKKARECFYKGLTATTKAERDMNLAYTFRALGQIMHLVQDGAVPAHVRNDPHVYLEFLGLKVGKYHFEKWVQDNFERIPLGASHFDMSIFDVIPEATAPILIANIFDTNQYDGTNPNVATALKIGISEYANANFFSGNTIFKKYPHPALQDTNIFSIDWKNPQIADAEDGKLDRRIYVKKTIGEPLDRLASLSYISFDCLKKGLYQYSPLVLDDKVYEEYASKLVPRAVAYAVGLLEYFFRGKLDIIQQSESVQIRNLSPEDMSGIFSLFYDDKGGQRKPVISASWNLSICPGNTSAPLSFTEPSDIGDDHNYIMVFRGRLGKELDAVVGKFWQMEKYYWAVIVNQPPLWSYGYWIREREGTSTDCGTTSGSLQDVNVIANCPEANLRVYLLASNQPFYDASYNPVEGCEGSLRIMNIGQFRKEEVFSKVEYSTNTREVFWRQVLDDWGFFVCQLRNGITAYGLDSLSVETISEWKILSWVELPANSLELDRIKTTLPSGRMIRSALKSDNFSDGVYNVTTFPLGSFSFASAGFLDDWFHTFSENESTICYCFSRCSQPEFCASTLGRLGPVERLKYVYIRIR